MTTPGGLYRPSLGGGGLIAGTLVRYMCVYIYMCVCVCVLRSDLGELYVYIYIYICVYMCICRELGTLGLGLYIYVYICVFV